MDCLAFMPNEPASYGTYFIVKNMDLQSETCVHNLHETVKETTNKIYGGGDTRDHTISCCTEIKNGNVCGEYPGITS